MTGRGRQQSRLHRGDIDGLRAVAVLSVMFHHYLVSGFRGGFVGVDVFFVISGFLIAAHIDSDIDAGRFSLLAFYERRIRRILPALVLMYALFLVLASKVYFPPDLHVEQPFRGPRALLNRPNLYGIAAASGVALVLATVVMRRVADPRRYSAREHTLFPSDTADQTRCRSTFPEDAQAPSCKLGDKSAPVVGILWGDSHALAILPAVNAVYTAHHRAAIIAEGSGCPPLLGVQVRDFSTAESNLFQSWRDAHVHGRSERCKRQTDAVLNWIFSNHIGTVILAAHRIAYAEDKHSRRLTDAQSPENYSLLDNAAVFARGLDRLLAALEGEHVRVFLLDDVPQSIVYVPYALASPRRLHLDREFRISRVTYEAQQLSATAIFARLQKRYGFKVLKPQDYLCAGGMCAIARNDAPLYIDGDHLSELGAMISEPAVDAIGDDKVAPVRTLHMLVKNAL